METTDGRQARSLRTRAAVAEAMLDCLEEGMLRPSAKEVAQRASVSTRAVFRHFEKMEALLEEAAKLQIERVVRELPPAVVTGSLDERIDALVHHSVQRNERVAPVRRAALLSEPFSKVIRDKLAWMRAEVRRQVRSAFAEELASLSESNRNDRVVAIRALLSFSYWEELRRHSRQSTASTTRILRGAVRAMLPT